MGGKSSNNLREETFILLMVSKVQSMASISKLKMGQQKQQEGSGCSPYGGQKTEGSQQEGVGQDTAPEDASQDPTPPSRLHL